VANFSVARWSGIARHRPAHPASRTPPHGARQLMNFLHHCASARIDQRYPITGIDVAIFSQGRPQSDGTVASSTSLGTLAPTTIFSRVIYSMAWPPLKSDALRGFQAN
jgi:hypothetical protein